ncbi:MAG: hypothetical protein QM695_01365 [Micropruina sp.]
MINDNIVAADVKGTRLEYLGYLVDRLAEQGSDAKVFGGGAG